MENKNNNLENIRHSLAHLLAAATLKEFPKAKLGIGPVIENGFYYDFYFTNSHKSHHEFTQITVTDLPKIEATMRNLIKENCVFTGEKISPLKAKKLFIKQPFKLELIKDFAKEKKQLTVYHTDPKTTNYKLPTTHYFTDLCKGGHIKNTNEINPEAFKLVSIAGAYWKGSEKNPQMQRIYGLAFETKKELDEYIIQQEEAKKRDHRVLGEKLRLFTIVDAVGQGLPLFYPKGAILRRLLENYITELQESKGYEPIWIPHITKAELYKISGHLDKYDAMYPPMKLKDEADYYLKPMNCPHFMMLYKSLPHSYKELPVRYTCTTTNYRYEKSGELSGLTRVRALTQDDCHVFTRPDQIEQEVNLMLDMIEEVYATFGFKEFWARISTHDPKQKEKYIGDPKIWKDAEATLSHLITKRGWKNEIGVGEAAFYGPKLDFIFKDVIGREWQLSTIQLDMNLPKRFELEYIDSDNTKKQPVLIHRAILGSTERFMGILIEHYAGAFPVWLSPVQARILAISEKHQNYAEQIAKELKLKNIRTEISEANETLGKRIRETEIQKIPYTIVVGDKEIENKSLSIRQRAKGDIGVFTLEKFIDRLREEIEQKL